jgi:phenylacetate-CoA ligase
MTAWDRFRDDVRAEMGAAESAQTERADLHRLLRYAAEHSPFHGRRLAGIDLTAVDPADLSALPVMTKADMMDGLDDVFTDRRLRTPDVEAALAATGAMPVPILGDYVALASGGSSGRRGMFVFDRAALAAFIGSLSRPTAASPGLEGLTIALVAAASAVHATGFVPALTCGGGWPFRIELVPAALPLAEIVHRLNALQPSALHGYASMVARLAAEARAGGLRITPVSVNTTSEMLLPEMRAAITQAFGVPVVDTFACTEGLVGKTAPGDDVHVFNTDTCIVELVDAVNHPVPQGVPSAKVLVTNLANLTQPLIRYELADAFVRRPDAAEHGRLRAQVQGRSDEVLHYADADVHPITVRSVIVRTPEVIDYQVRQTPRGVDVSAVTADGLPVDDLVARLRRALADAGLERPDVTVQVVDKLDRHPDTGKLRRFIPLGSC